MRVLMKTLECGPNGNFPAGSEREVSAEHGQQLVAGGYAVDITPKVVETAAVAVTETAAVVADEVAAIAPVETRSKGRRNK